MDTISAALRLEDLALAKGPKYSRVADMVRQAVTSGLLKPGTKLPPVRELAYQLSITPGTVARAYTVLTDEGVLEAGVGRGTFVAQLSDPRGDDAFQDVDPVPHGSEGMAWPIRLTAPALPNVGQAALIRQLMGEVAREPASGLMHYPTREAFKPAREAVRDWMSFLQTGALHESDIVLSHGAQNGIMLVMQAILKGRRPVILVDELAYPGFRRAAELLRAELVSVAMDEEGTLPEALASAARAHEAQIYCTTPDAQNPTARFTGVARRRALAEVARDCDFQILEDYCYNRGDQDTPCYRVLAPERAWLIASLSKCFTPALRVGFAIAPEGKGPRLRQAAEHGFFGLATPLADLTALLLPHPKVPQIMSRVNEVMEQYRQRAMNILGTYEALSSPHVPFIWLPLPTGWRSAEFCRACEAEGIRVRAGEDFALRDGRVPQAVRLAVNAAIPLERFELAIRTISDLIRTPPETIGG